MDTLLKKLELKVCKTKTCWLWVGGRNNGGYGQTKVNKKNVTVHRLFYELYKGKIPKGLLILHKCDNPPCVNPKHLFLGTNKQNTQDMMKKGRNNPQRGENHKDSKLTYEKAAEIRELRKLGYKYRELAEKYGVSDSSIWQVLKGICWIKND